VGDDSDLLARLRRSSLARKPSGDVPVPISDAVGGKGEVVSAAAALARLTQGPDRPDRKANGAGESVIDRIKQTRKAAPSDIERILSLRVVDESDYEDFTDSLKRPGGELTLRSVQSRCLAEAASAGGLLAAVGVGWGKTLVAFLLPLVLDSLRPLLIIPASMREQCFQDWQFYGRHFQLPKRLVVRSYEELSSPNRSGMLRILRPDLIISDEAHKLRYTDSTRTRRIRRYLREHPECQFAALSGTMTNRSLGDYAHISRWALGDGSPLPISYSLLSSWKSALEGDEPSTQDMARIHKLCNKFGNEDPRAAFQKRLRSAPGVVATSDQGVGASLVLHHRRPNIPANLREVLNQVDKTWTTPDGEELEDALAKSRVERQLICGFWYYWDWSAPPWNGTPDYDWLMARREWHKVVREAILRRSVEGLDSPILLARACELGIPVPNAVIEAWEGWKPHRHKASPPTLPRWVDDYLVRDTLRWAEEQEDAPLMWYTHLAFAHRLSELSGWDLFGAGSESSERIVSIKEPRPIIVSVSAHSTGKNLQVYGNQILTNPISSGSSMEQLLGRTHRSGQARDVVEGTVYMHRIFDEAMQRAMSDARYTQDTTGQRQRLCYASRTGFGGAASVVGDALES